MKKIASFIIKKRFFIITFFLIAAIASGFFVSKVKINYDISKYLNSESETSLALKIIEDQFGVNGNMQVMVSNVDLDISKEIQKSIENIDYVIDVNFDPYSTDYYKDNNALYILIIDGDDYSEHAKSVTSDVNDLLKNYKTAYAGTTIDKQRLQESIESEMIYIIIVAISLAIAILLLTSESWIEPLILLGTAGIAILINLGTNVFFSSISYITKSISAILQLALSIDYSIVLLHTYRKNKGLISNQEAMEKAILQVVKPVSASGLTTLAGLCALLFMSYRIGFDIGIVLMKGILISLITSITLLPGVVLLFDHLLEKTHKKSIQFSGEFFAKTAKKGSKIIISIGLILIISCAALNFNNTYVYSNQSNVDSIISETFAKNNQFMVVFPNSVSDYENQETFINEIKQFRTKDDKDVFVNYTSYTNTILEHYNQEKIVQKLEISKDEANMLLTMYNLYKNPNNVKLSFSEMVSYSNYLLENDEDAKTYAEENTKSTIKKLEAIKILLENDNSSDILYTMLTSDPLNEITNNVKRFSIDEIYGLYFYDSIEDNEVAFNTMLNFIVYAGENIHEFKSVIDPNTLASLKIVSNNVNERITKANTPLTRKTFQNYMYQTYNKVLTDEQVSMIYSSYFTSTGTPESETINYLNLMNFLVKSGQITDENAIASINESNKQYQLVISKYAFDEFIPTLKAVIYASTGLLPEISITNDDIHMVYVTYLNQVGSFNNMKIKGTNFVNFVKSMYENSDYMKDQIGEALYTSICDLNLIDSYLINDQKFNYLEIFNIVDNLKNSIHTNLENGEMNSDMISGVFIKYEINHENKLTTPIIATDLLAFINENKETNSILMKKLDQNKLDKIDDANEKINTANKLFKGSKYSRLLISMNLDMEGKDTENFVTYLKETATKYFGQDSYIAGESVSTNDLKNSFKIDELIISIVTIVSILIIVALTFKSVSLPVILVLVIQGACWIAFATNAITGSVFFMSYIIASCILMGATVDYGILMSTNYIENRKTMDKYGALKFSIKTSLPTIFTSGLILTVCGFTICFISSQASISSVGLLVGKGTLAAIALILFLLPSLLYLLDKIILKTTYKKNNL